MLKKNEANIWAGIKKGDSEAYGELYNLYIDTLIFYGFKFTNNKNHVMDSIHDLFIDLYKSKSKLSDTDSIEFYLKASLKRKIYKNSKTKIKEVRVKTNSKEIQLYTSNNYIKSHEETVIFSESRKERKVKLNKAFTTLSKTQRKGLDLRYKKDYSYEEIAQTLGISVSSARTTVYRAIKSLRQYPLFLSIAIGNFF